MKSCRDLATLNSVNKPVVLESCLFINYVGICIKICSILLHYPFKFKSGGFRLHMKPSVKEQAPYRPGLDGKRERELYSFTVCDQSIDYPCLDST